MVLSYSHANQTPVDALSQNKGVPSPIGIATQPGVSQGSPSRNAARQERLERMREKREQQRRKREAQEKSKLGEKLANISSLDDGREESEGESGDESASEHPQYSPSVSHDEVEQWEGLEGGEMAPVNSELPTYQKQKSRESGISRSSSKGKADFSSSQTHRDDEEEDPAAWDDNSLETSREEKSGNWEQVSLYGGSGSSVSSPSSAGTKGGWKRERTTSEGGGKKGPPASSAAASGDSSPRGNTRSKSQVSGPAKKSDSLRGRLAEEDIQRLEQQAAWTTEPDFFADMEPSIGSSQEGLQKASSKPSSASSRSGSGSTAALLLYQPADQEEVSVGSSN